MQVGTSVFLDKPTADIQEAAVRTIIGHIEFGVSSIGKDEIDAESFSASRGECSEDLARMGLDISLSILPVPGAILKPQDELSVE